MKSEVLASASMLSAPSACVIKHCLLLFFLSFSNCISCHSIGDCYLKFFLSKSQKLHAINHLDSAWKENLPRWMSFRVYLFLSPLKIEENSFMNSLRKPSICTNPRASRISYKVILFIISYKFFYTVNNYSFNLSKHYNRLENKRFFSHIFTIKLTSLTAKT